MRQSSANNLVVAILWVLLIKSLMNIRKRVGPKTKPCRCDLT